MYRPVTSVKLLWSTIGLVVIMLLGGCPSVPVVEEAPEPQTPQDIAAPEVDTTTYHVVLRGETLAAIAQRFGRNYLDIAEWNNISPPFIISVDQRLRVDGPSVTTPKAGIPAITPVSPAPTPISDSPHATGNTHTVQAKENLYSIARLYNQKFQDLATWNNIAPPYILSIGQVLKVFLPDGLESTPPVTDPIDPISPIEEGRNYHIVLASDTLYKIASHYGFSVPEIAAWNNLQESDTLSIGQKLWVNPPSADNELLAPLPENPVDDESGYHIVIKEDTLYGLSQRYGQSVADLAKWNNLPLPYTLSLGQKLRVAPPTMLPDLTPVNPNIRPVGLDSLPGYHIVKKKETLHGIAKKYGVSLLDLADWNGIGNPYTVYPSQRLTIIPH